jgi:hypothetical protein
MCLLVCGLCVDVSKSTVVALAIKRQEYQAKKALEAQFEGSNSPYPVAEAHLLPSKRSSVAGVDSNAESSADFGFP